MAKAKKPTGRKKKEEDEETEPLTNYQDATPQALAWKKAEEEKNKVTKKKLTTSIEKVRIVDQNFLSIEFTKIEADGSTSSHNEAYAGRYMHTDTRNKFKMLAIHWGILCGFIHSRKIQSLESYEPAMVEKINVTGVIIKPEEGFQLIGHRPNEYGKAVNINTPYTLFNQEQKSAYKFVEEVREQIDELVQDVLEYLSGKKVGEDPQGKLPFDTPAEAAA